jgi:RNA polymerase sigma-70 factor (ECF subfamily)
MDTDLVKRAQRGDSEAFTSLATGLGDRFLAVSNRILGDIGLAEDATQQALLNVWRDLPKLRDPARFEAWAYRLLVRACYAEGHRGRLWAPNLHLLPVDEPMAADHTNSVIDRDQLERAFRRLTLKHRLVLVLHHYLDLSPDAIADALDVPVGTIASRMHYALRAMRRAIDADAAPTPREVAR